MKKLLFDLFPVIVFFIAYKIGDANAEATRAFMASVGLPQPVGAGEKPGIYLATLVAIVASFGQIGWVKLRGHKVETMLWVTLASSCCSAAPPCGCTTRASSSGSRPCCTGFLPPSFLAPPHSAATSSKA
jgi:hypothetical protein